MKWSSQITFEPICITPYFKDILLCETRLSSLVHTLIKYLYTPVPIKPTGLTRMLYGPPRTVLEMIGKHTAFSENLERKHLEDIEKRSAKNFVDNNNVSFISVVLESSWKNSKPGRKFWGNILRNSRRIFGISNKF